MNRLSLARRRASSRRPAWVWAAAALIGLPLLGAAGDGLPSERAARVTASPDPFPTVWVLSKRRYRASARMFVVREQVVVAFADGTYSTNPAALYGVDGDAPGTGDRRGEWRLDGDRLLTRFDDRDGAFRPQYFPRFRTRPAPPGLRLSGCYSGDEVVAYFRFDRICFDADGTYRRTTGDLVSRRERAVGGTYRIDGHRLALREGNSEVRTIFGILAGDASAPTRIVVDRERFSQ